MRTIPAETKALATCALRNAFYADFSALVNAYLKAAEGLDTAALERQLGEVSDVFSRDSGAEAVCYPNIWTRNTGTGFSTTGHGSILEALEFDNALEVHLQGRTIFERRKGEWRYVTSEVGDDRTTQRWIAPVQHSCNRSHLTDEQK